MSLLLSLALLAPQQLELVDAFASADPLALTVDALEERAYVVEGSRLVELAIDAAGRLTELRDMRLDVTPQSLLVAGSQLWVAGGTHGLWTIDLRADVLGAVQVDSAPQMVCTDVVSDGRRVTASYAALEGSVLRVYAEADGARLGTLELPAWRALGLASAGDNLAVALGRDGVLPVQFEGGTPTIQGDPSHPPASEELTDGYVRDVALVEGRPFASMGGARYVVRVDADAERWASASMRAPAYMADGAPYGLTGAMPVTLAPGGVEGTVEEYGANRDHLIVGTHDGKQEWSVELKSSGWRSLVLRDRFVYTLRLRDGLQVWKPEGKVLVEAFRRAPTGVSAIDGVVSRRAPGLVLFGSDGMGAKQLGALRRTAEGMDSAGEAWQQLGNLGLFPSEPQPGPAGEEWLFGGTGLGPSLFRIGKTPARWGIALPEDALGHRGHTYFHGERIGPWLAVARVASADGLVLFSWQELLDLAAATHPGETIAAKPVAVLRTHPSDSPDPPFTFRSSGIVLPDRRLVCVVAAGMGRESEDSAKVRGRVILAHVSKDGLKHLATMFTSHAPDNTIAVDTLEHEGRAYAFAGGMGGYVSVFDITDPLVAIEIATWTLGPHPFDDAHDPILDLQVVSPPGAPISVLAANGRRGLVHLQFTPENWRLTVEQVIDTPGWAAGVYATPQPETNGAYDVFVGDQKSGMRVYRLPAPPAAGPQTGR